MSEKYISSVIHQYGSDADVKQDCKTIMSIIDRQGSNLLIDCIAEYAGECANKFSMNQADRDRLFKSLNDRLQYKLSERI